jgi:hypothetical protein
VAHVQSTPELSDGVESLHYWRDRQERLSWYNVRARREAARMIIRVEDRLRETLFYHPSAPMAARLSAGVMIARGRFGRWKRKAKRGAAAVVGLSIAIIAIPLIALLIHSL